MIHVTPRSEQYQKKSEGPSATVEPDCAVTRVFLMQDEDDTASWVKKMRKKQGKVAGAPFSLCELVYHFGQAVEVFCRMARPEHTDCV